MKADRLGCLSSGAIIAAVIVALLVTISALASGGSMFSPGTLNAQPGNVLGGVASHADIGGKCGACHVAPWSQVTMDDRCSTCHVDVALEMLDPASVHGRMMRIDPRAMCRTCHPEHHGSNGLLTVLEGWQFPHEVSRFSLKSHQFTAEKEPFLCADCHGEDVMQFDVQTCTKCHISMDMEFMVNHEVAFGDRCLECHDGVERYGHDFDHNKFAFNLEGKHAGLMCSRCHIQSTSITALQATSQDCFSCHAKDDPHQGSLGPDCAMCHSPEEWSSSIFDHNRSVFKLTGAHMQVVCELCHVNAVFKDTPQDCFSCHQQIDLHMGQFGAACGQCHTTTAWKPAQFDHNTTGFPLTGSHVNVECKACHIEGVYKNTPRDCFSCHAARDVHNGQYGRNCGACHQTMTWSRAAFDHNNTVFPLIGNHVRVSCLSCHINGNFKGTSMNCFSCHAKDDHHNGQFGQDCSTCHIPTGWNNITFDHNASAFPLTGKHAQLECTRCHSSGQFQIPMDCVSCHTEPAFHVGAFGTSCAECHNTSGWTSPVFARDHPTALGQNFLDHHGATCRTCHTNTVSQFTCLACHETNPLSPGDEIPIPTGTPVTNEPSVVTSISSPSIQVGDTSQLTVQLNDIVPQTYTSTEFTCTYDPTLVEISNISVGDLFGPDAALAIFGPRNGSFILAVAGSNGRKITGSGTAFTFNAKGLKVGTTSIECRARVSEGQDILHEIDYLSSSMIIVGAIPTVDLPIASVTGQVLAEKVVTIRLYNPNNSIVATGTTNPDGTFNLTGAGGNYTITASAEGYLSAQGSVTLVNGSVTTKPTISLIPGDIDGNGVVDQLDAITIRMNYNRTTPTSADLNNDGVIDVLDLGILAENYGKSGAQPWP